MCYIISAKDSVQRFQDYCKGGEFPVFVPRDDTYAIPFPSSAIAKCDYKTLVDSDCKIYIGVICSDSDRTEIKERKSDKRLFVDYVEEVAGVACNSAVVYVCNSSDGDKGIALEKAIFDLLCTTYKLYKDALWRSMSVYLQVGAAIFIVAIMLDSVVIGAYLAVESQVGKESILFKSYKKTLIGVSRGRWGWIFCFFYGTFKRSC